MPFTAATYDVLATAYLGRGDYSAAPPHVLDPDLRVRTLVRHVAALDADVLCLQEVEADVSDALRTGPEPLGYIGHIEFEGSGKPDGCATFFRTGVFSLRKTAGLEYLDEEKGSGRHSGHVALMLAFEHAGRLLGVANTHFRWDRPGTPRQNQVGHRQAVESIEACRRFEPACDAWVACGDFNCGPASEVVATFRSEGFELAPAGRPRVHSAVANGRALLIDHLFYTGRLATSPIDPPPVSDGEVLPSEEKPSDHLASKAAFEWADSA